MKHNPRVGFHPDLFETHDTVLVQALSKLTEKQFARLRRDDFTDDEWEDLTEEVAEQIYEQDSISKARIAKLVNAFVKRYKWATEPGDDEAIDSVVDYFSQWLSEEDENLIGYGGEEAQDLIEIFVTEGWTRDDVEGALTQALKEEDNYVFGTTHNEYESAFFKARAFTSGVYIERSEIDELLKGLHEDEIEIAIEEINHETYSGFIQREDFDKKYGIEKDVDCDVYVTAKPDWDKIRNAVKNALADIGKKGGVEPAARPIAERIVYTFPDGAYVVDLLPSELKAEGDTLGICVGKASYGYAAAVRAGHTKIMSLRTRAGRPKFTIEVEMDRDTGRARHVRQIKGKGNRLPSKADEVQKLVLLMEHLGQDPERVADLQPGLRALTGLPIKNPARKHEHCGFCRVEARR